MSTIYEDIQALRERFKTEYGLEVNIHVSAYSTQNSNVPGYPTRQAVDLTCNGGMQVEMEERQSKLEDGRLLRWFKFDDFRNGMEITLFRNSV